MRDHSWRKRKRNAGAVVVELAVTAPLLFLMMAGAADFARVFHYAIAVANASGSGSFWGAQSNVKAVSHGDVEQAATTDVVDLSGAIASSEMYCDCPSASGGTEVDCIEGTCAEYGKPRVYSKTTVEYTFEALLPWPGIPNPVVVTREHYQRVQ